MKQWLVMVFIFSCLYFSKTSNILGVFPLPVRSHFNMFESILKTLAERGHEVDVMSHFPQKKHIKRYQERAKIASDRFKDRPMGPLNTSIYWIEYVIRHRGAPYLRSIGADLPWYQYYLIDIAVVFVITILAVGYVLLNIFKLLLNWRVNKTKQD